MKDSLKNIDKILLIVTIFLSIFGLVMIFSASSIAAVQLYKVPESYFFARQAFILALGTFLSLIIINIKSKNWGVIGLFGIFIAIGALIFTYLYGTVTNSAKSWLTIGTITIQPSEFAKVAIILYLSCIYGNRNKRNAFGKFWEIFLPLIPCVVIFFLVASEPDLGTALIIAVICMFVFFALPFKKTAGLTALKLVTVGSIVGLLVFLNINSDLLNSILTHTQESRFNFRNPCERYLEETGYQVCNGYIAINNGGLLGVGLGKSTQKYLYLPESHTDFIFPIIIEELGLVFGGGLVFILYIILLYRILLIARTAKNLRCSILAFGTFGYILTHIIVNMGGLLALIPLTGVPLPFLSYGGSFTLNLLMAIAFTQRVAIENKSKKVG